MKLFALCALALVVLILVGCGVDPSTPTPLPTLAPMPPTATVPITSVPPTSTPDPSAAARRYLDKDIAWLENFRSGVAQLNTSLTDLNGESSSFAQPGWRSRVEDAFTILTLTADDVLAFKSEPPEFADVQADMQAIAVDMKAWAGESDMALKNDAPVAWVSAVSRHLARQLEWFKDAESKLALIKARYNLSK